MSTFDEEAGGARIKVMAAGETGDRIASRLGRLMTGINCLPDLTSLDVLSRAIADSDIIFIVSGLEHEAVSGRAAEIAALARESGSCKILVALVAKSSMARTDETLESYRTLEATVDGLFLVSHDCLIPIDDSAPKVLSDSALEEYLVRLIAADIVRIIMEAGIICIDFADIREILCGGSSKASLGIGIANGERGARDAAMKALQALKPQGPDLRQGGAYLAWITSSSNVTMDDFDAASRIIHEAVDADANIVVGLLIDDALAGNIRVAIVAKPDAVPVPAKDDIRLRLFLMG